MVAGREEWGERAEEPCQAACQAWTVLRLLNGRGLSALGGAPVEVVPDGGKRRRTPKALVFEPSDARLNPLGLSHGSTPAEVRFRLIESAETSASSAELCVLAFTVP